MSNVEPPEPSAAERERQHTLPPDEIRLADPVGPVVYAEVSDEEGLAGYAWAARRLDAVPRAGLILLPFKVRDPSELVQDDIGEVTLRASDQPFDAEEFMDYLTATRDGQGGKAIMADWRSAQSLDVVRRLAGQYD